jgi:hypothetical protein
MRRSGFLIPCFAILLAACNESVITDVPVDASEAGKVTFTLSADLRNDVVDVKSSAEEISVDDFWVEIFNSKKIRIFCEKYADAKDTTLYVNSGDYTLLATYGTENSVGFDKPFYKAEEPFTVGPQETKPLAATATLANVKVAVNFDEDLDNKLSYEQYWAVVRNNGKKLRFNPAETRAGYIPAGNLEFVLVVKINGEYKQYVHPAAEYAPNDFVTFNVSAPLMDGNVVIKVLIDNTVEIVEVDEIVVPIEDMLPLEEPAIYSEGFDNDNSITFVDTKAPVKNELWISATAEGVLSSAVLSIDCPDLGLPAEIDLATADGAVASAYEAKGIWWKFNADRTSLSISLLDAYDDHISKLGYRGYDHDAGRPLPAAEIGLKIETASGAVRTAEENYVVYVEPDAARGSFSWNDYDVWATRIVNPVLTLGEGKYDMTKIQYSMDGQTWIDFQDVTSSEYSMGTVEGLDAGTTYYLRAIYDGWLEVAAPVSFTTEAAQQVGNAGFEEWQVLSYTYTTKLISTSSKSRDWYIPWNADEDDIWWAVNSKKTMPSETTPQEQPYKVCPTVSFCTTDAHEGTKSAQIATVFVSNGATSSTFAANSPWTYTSAAGELFIGAADADGNHSSEGHRFLSRPLELTFRYKYESYKEETFYVSVVLKNEQNEIIASNEVLDGAAASSWTEMSIPLNYINETSKASDIYICFKSTSASSPSYDKGKSLEMNGTTQKGHMGSVLKIDDLVLIYK